jgi:hypothetical protein
MATDFHIYVTTVGLSHIDVKLPHELNNGNWQIGLSEISYFKVKTVFPTIDVYCDIIAPNIKNGMSRQILRRVYSEKGEVTIRFNPIFYSSVLRTTFDRMTLYLKSDSEDISSFKDTTVNCSLHVRQIDNDKLRSEYSGL